MNHLILVSEFDADSASTNLYLAQVDAACLLLGTDGLATSEVLQQLTEKLKFKCSLSFSTTLLLLHIKDGIAVCQEEWHRPRRHRAYLDQYVFTRTGLVHLQPPTMLD